MSKCLVAMSGGVDSSVTALICRDTYGPKNTWGVHLNLAPPTQCSTSARTCCGSRDAQDALTVAQNIGIYFDEIPMHEAFSKYVIEDFVAAYNSGHTPVPCTICNGQLKYKLLVDYADSAGYEFIATGHYVQQIAGRIVADPNNPKDQSWFLWQIPTHTLPRCLFPVGHMPKEQTRAIAQSNNLTVATKPDSQNLCFVANSYKQTLLELRPDLFTHREGKILFNNTIISNHQGHWNYTQGQKTHGYYVVGKDVKTNTVYVDRQPRTYTSIKLRDINTHETPNSDLFVRTGSRANYLPARLIGDTVHTETPVAATPGQSAVLYRKIPEGMLLVAGGWIV
jgi:tRNA-specific 2-thiouridylase